MSSNNNEAIQTRHCYYDLRRRSLPFARFTIEGIKVFSASEASSNKKQCIWGVIIPLALTEVTHAVLDDQEDAVK